MKLRRTKKLCHFFGPPSITSYRTIVTWSYFSGEIGLAEICSPVSTSVSQSHLHSVPHGRPCSSISLQNDKEVWPFLFQPSGIHCRWPCIARHWHWLSFVHSWRPCCTAELVTDCHSLRCLGLSCKHECTLTYSRHVPTVTTCTLTKGGQMYKLLMSNFLRILHNKNH